MKWKRVVWPLLFFLLTAASASFADEPFSSQDAGTGPRVGDTILIRNPDLPSLKLARVIDVCRRGCIKVRQQVGEYQGGVPAYRKFYLYDDEYFKEVDRLALPDGRVIDKHSVFKFSAHLYLGGRKLEEGPAVHIFENGSVAIETYSPCGCPAGWVGEVFGQDDWGAERKIEVYSIAPSGEKITESSDVAGLLPVGSPQ